jgi:hypothetical protein
MRLGISTLSVTLSAALLSGCSFISGQPGQYKNPFAKQKAAQHGQYGAYSQASAAQHCQIATPRHPIPRGCRPEQVTIGVNPQGYGGLSYGANGFPQQPQFGQPQYTSGAYGSAVGQTQNVAYHTAGPRKRKPRLRGSLSLGAESSVGGSLINQGDRLGPDIDTLAGYNPQNWIAARSEETDDGRIEYVYTANEQFAADIYAPETYESDSRPDISFDDAWAAPASVKAGLEYIVNDNTTVFAAGGYTQAAGNSGITSIVDATIYREAFEFDDLGALVGQSVAYTPNVGIANFSYDFSDLRRYDFEVGARRYLKPVVKSQGYRTVTPFVGASVGASHVNATDITFSQRQAAYDTTFENITTGENEGRTDMFDVPPQNTGATPLLGTTARLYDAQWLPQGQLNVGAEWQITPGFALAAETGVKIQGAREYADFTNAAGETISGAKGDANISIPLTLRGSVNF